MGLLVLVVGAGELDRCLRQRKRTRLLRAHHRSEQEARDQQRLEALQRRVQIAPRVSQRPLYNCNGAQIRNMMSRRQRSGMRLREAFRFSKNNRKSWMDAIRPRDSSNSAGVGEHHVGAGGAAQDGVVTKRGSLRTPGPSAPKNRKSVTFSVGHNIPEVKEVDDRGDVEDGGASIVVAVDMPPASAPAPAPALASASASVPASAPALASAPAPAPAPVSTSA